MIRLAFFILLVATRAAATVELGAPADCQLGDTCFFQQFVDMQPGPGAVDPFCGGAAYDGHTGTDLRILSMADVARGVPVAAMAAGTVLRVRDGEPDRLVVSESGRAAVASKECGNGVVVNHGEGLEAQYCHMRRGSLVVQPGEHVEMGAKLGEIGASGLAQFPHVHVAIRVNGDIVDPITGRVLSAGCVADPALRAPLFSPKVMASISDDHRSELLAAGLAGGPIDHAALASNGPPESATGDSPNLVGWAWFINLEAGDRIRIRLTGPAGHVVVDSTSDPLDRDKATWSAYAGERGSPALGRYRLTVGVLRNGEMVIEDSREIELR